MIQYNMGRVSCFIIWWLVVVLCGVVFSYTDDSQVFVSAVGGKVCYAKWHEPQTIKHKKYHKNIEDCIYYINEYGLARKD